MSNVPTLVLPVETSMESPPNGEKTWTAGTLTYTRRGLIGLFVVLLIGDFAWSMRERSTNNMAQWYLTSLNIPSLWFGCIMTALPNLIQLFFAPVISVMSDRHRGKRGRRIPYLFFITPFVVVGMLGMGLTPAICRWLQEMGVVGSSNWAPVVCFMLFWTCFDFATTASGVVFFGLFNDVVPRDLMGRFYGFFRAISLIDGMIFNYWLMGLVPDYYMLLMCGIGLLYGIGLFTVCSFTKEGEYPQQELNEPKHSICKVDVKQYCRECFTNKYYISVFALMTLAAVSFAPVNLFSLPYARSLNFDMERYGQFLFTTYLVSFTLSFFIGWLADRIHPLRLALATLAGYAAVTGWAAFFAGSSDSFQLAFILHGVLAGCYLTGTMTLGPRLFPHSQFAQFYSASLILSSLATIVVGPLVGALIDASSLAMVEGPARKAYHLIFVAGCLLSLCALAAGFVVYFQFQRLGGATHYRAPEASACAADLSAPGGYTAGD